MASSEMSGCMLQTHGMRFRQDTSRTCLSKGKYKLFLKFSHNYTIILDLKMSFSYSLFNFYSKQFY